MQEAAAGNIDGAIEKLEDRLESKLEVSITKYKHMLVMVILGHVIHINPGKKVKSLNKI